MTVVMQPRTLVVEAREAWGAVEVLAPGRVRVTAAVEEPAQGRVREVAAVAKVATDLQPRPHWLRFRPPRPQRNQAQRRGPRLRWSSDRQQLAQQWLRSGQ